MPGSWKPFVFLCAAVIALAGQPAHAQPARPKIPGLAHAAFYASDLEKTFAFQHDLLGFDEVFDLRRDRIARYPSGLSRSMICNMSGVEIVEYKNSYLTFAP
jgi:hypothetical protein